MNRAQRRARGAFLSASLAAGSLIGYAGYQRPAYANGTSTCQVTDNSFNSTSAGTLRYCIANVAENGVISFAPDVKTISFSPTAEIPDNPIVINKSLTIQGSSSVDAVSPVIDGGSIAGSPGTSIFRIEAGADKVSFNEIGLVNGYTSGKGAAIYATNKLEIYLDSVYVADNVSAQSGGAVSNATMDSTVTVTSTGLFRSTFYKNQVAQPLLIRSSTRFQNLSGGAIHADSVILDDVYFDTNNAPHHGGAIAAYSVEARNSYFRLNSSVLRGGAIAIDEYGAATIENTEFGLNYSGSGGAVFGFDHSTISVDNSTFTFNRAPLGARQGGAIGAQYRAILDVNNSSFTMNIADGGAAIFGEVGSHHVYTTITNSTFSENYGAAGGAIIESGNLNMYFSTVYKNYFDNPGVDTSIIAGIKGDTLNIQNSIVAATINRSSGATEMFIGDLLSSNLSTSYTLTTDSLPLYLQPVGENEIISHFLPSANSPAIGAADPNFDFATNPDLATDQIGTTRTSPATVGAIQVDAVSSSSPTFSAPVPTTSPILTLQDIGPFSPGENVVARVSNATRVEGISIGETEAEILSFEEGLLTFTVPELESGEYSITGVFNSGTVVFDVGMMIDAITSQSLELSVWTKKVSDTEVKVYAKNPIGNGKIQFFVDDEEIAWIRAEDSDDPKLSQAQGFYYLVRTVELTDSKQAIEIYVDGVRQWRAAYKATN